MNNQGTRFKQLRQLLGLTQQEVADMVEINQGHISTYERNKCVNAEARKQIDKFTAAVRQVMREQSKWKD